jgi:hypothetical protein
MLGYSRLQQCERYLKQVEKKAETGSAKAAVEPETGRMTELAAA